jgi:predicted MFS family arabinose efflux permease
VPFAVLSTVWFTGAWHPADGPAYRWMPLLFLLLYATFFSVTGMNQLAAHTLQGKLIRPERRGRLLTTSVVVGASSAILAAWLLMPRWLALPDGGFGWLFGVPALMFMISATTALFLCERPDDFEAPSAKFASHFREAWRILVVDPDFRRLAIVAALFGGSFMMFPHYQALGRERLGLDLTNLMLWVCTQNVATTLASVLVGPLADRYGNRTALQVAILSAACAPLAALVIGQLDPALGSRLYWLVFLPIGATPISITLMINYTLEITTREHHPRYVSTVGMCLAAPVIVGAPLVGGLVEVAGFDMVFLGGTLVVGLSGMLTFRLIEPRHRRRDENTGH